MNKVKVLFYATLKDKAGIAQAELDLPDNISIAEFKELLFRRYPNLPKSKANLLVAVNKEYAFDDELVLAGAEVALFPPVSGG